MMMMMMMIMVIMINLGKISYDTLQCLLPSPLLSRMAALIVITEIQNTFQSESYEALEEM
jgi:hypothetical protein